MMSSPFLTAMLARSGVPSGSMMPGALSAPLALQQAGAPPVAPQVPLLPNAARGGIGPEPRLPPGPQPPPGPFSSLLNDPVRLAQLFRIMFPGGSGQTPSGIPDLGTLGFGSLGGFGALGGSGAAGADGLAGLGLLSDGGLSLAGSSAIEDLGPLAFAGVL